MYHSMSPQSLLEHKLIGSWRNIHFKGGGTTLENIEAILYDMEGLPNLIVCENAIIKWELVSHVTFSSNVGE